VFISLSKLKSLIDFLSTKHLCCNMYLVKIYATTAVVETIMKKDLYDSFNDNSIVIVHETWLNGNGHL
jgi:hypothetical protein